MKRMVDPIWMTINQVNTGGTDYSNGRFERVNLFARFLHKNV